MPKRKAEESKEDRWRRKMKKYEHKLSRRRHGIIYSSDEDNEDGLGHNASEMLLDVSVQPDLCSASPHKTAAELDPEIPGTVVQEHEVSAPEVAQPAAEKSTVVVAGAEPAVEEAGPSKPAVAEPLPLQPSEPTAAEAVDPEFLKALGDFQDEISEWGSDINTNLAQRWLPILKEGLKKEVKDEITKKYLVPKNCALMKAPVLNPEISAVLIDSAKNRDARILKKQSQMGLALTVLGKAMTGILTKSSETSETLRLLNDTAKFIADSHFAETETRRTLIVPMLDKDFIEPFKDRKRDSYLFGDKLDDFIKSSRGIKKTGQLMQSTGSTPNTSNNNLNFRAPPPFRQQAQRAQQTPARRAVGGPRTQAPSAAYRRRAFAPPPAPPARQAPMTSPRRAATTQRPVLQRARR